MSVRKRFDKQLYEQHNPVTQIVLGHLLAEEASKNGGVPKERSWGEHPDRYGPDLVHAETGRCVEVEVKLIWVSPPSFPYPTLQIPVRKERLFQQYNMPSFELWTVSKDHSHALITPREVILAAPRKEVPNKYIYKGEYFWQVPVEQCTIIKLTRK